MLDQRYKRFADLVREAETNTVDLLLQYKESDPYRYKAKVDEFLIELRTYRTILNSVKDLSEPKKKTNPNFVQKFKDDMKGLIEKING